MTNILITPPVARLEAAVAAPLASPASHAARDQDWQWRGLQGLLIVLDGLVTFTCLTLAYETRIASGLLAYNAVYDPLGYQQLALLSAALLPLLFLAGGLYRRDLLLGGVVEYQQVLRGCMYGIVALVMVSYLTRAGAFEPSRGWLLLSLGLLCLSLVGERFLVRRLGYWLRGRGWLTARVLIVGANAQGMAIAEQWTRSATSGMCVTGFLDDFQPVGSPVVDGLQVLGRPSALDAIVRATGAQEVVLVTGAVAWETFEEIIAGAARRTGYTVRLSPGFYEMLATGVAVSNKTFVPLFTVNEDRLVGVDAALKWSLDYALALPLAVITLPLLGIIALALKLAGAGRPLLDTYQTIGRNGRPFRMIKFHTQPAAPTWIEQVLLDTGLDKLPQLYNVLAGQMAVVGPRPRLIDELASDPCTAHNLQTMKPGMLGPWLLAGHQASGDENRDDLHYVRNWTIWLDLQILLRSLAWVVTGSRGRLAAKRQDRERKG